LAAKIVPFPVNSEQDCTEVEKLIRRWLQELPASPELSDCVTARMMSFITTYANKVFEPTFNLAVPAHMTEGEAEALLRSIEKGVDNTAFQIQEMINKIIIERFFLEVEMQETRPIAHKPCKVAVITEGRRFQPLQ